jgi:AraC-like DNA-binding protein
MLVLFGSILPGSGKVFTRLSAADGLNDNQVQQLLQLPDGRMAITTFGNLSFYDGAGFTYIHRQEGMGYPLEKYIGSYDVTADGCGRLWIKDMHRLLCMDLRKQRYVADIQPLFYGMGVRDSAQNVFIDRRKNIYVLTGRGLWDTRNHRCYHLPGDAGYLQLVEPWGRTLCCFFSLGEVVGIDSGSGRVLYRSRPYSLRESSLYDLWIVLEEAKNGVFYIKRSNKKGCVLTFRPATRRWTILVQRWKPLHRFCMMPDGTLLMATDDGLWRASSSATPKLTRVPVSLADGTLVSGGMNDVRLDRQGGLWIATFNKGVLYSGPVQSQFSTIEGDNTNARSLRPNKTFAGHQFVCVVTDMRGMTWCGTPDGLWLYRSRNMAPEIFHTENGLTNDFIHSITVDRRGNLWAATSNGITKIGVGRGGRVVFTRFREASTETEYLDGAARLLPDGRIAMQNVRGWTLFNPDSVRPRVFSLTPLLTSVSLWGEPVNVDSLYDGRRLMDVAPPYLKRLELESHQNMLAFTFSAMNYSEPGQTYYRFRLKDGGRWQVEGPGERGSMVDKRGVLHLSFANLSFGHYQLEVMASTDGIHWTGGSNKLEIVIHAPWWLRWWAFALYFAMLAGFVFGITQLYMYNVRRKHREEMLLEQIRSLIKEGERRSDDEGAGAEQSLKPSDSEFVTKVVNLVESNLNTPGYSVEQLSRDLCMERSGLYKKLTAMIGTSPSLFIRSIRVRKAAQLIEEGSLSLSDIALKVGFSSQSYMSRCFQEEYGCKPSEYKGRKCE